MSNSDNPLDALKRAIDRAEEKHSFNRGGEFPSSTEDTVDSKTEKPEAPKSKLDTFILNSIFRTKTDFFIQVPIGIGVILIGGYFLIKFYLQNYLMGALGIFLGFSIAWFHGNKWQERFAIGIFFSIIALIILAFISSDSGVICYVSGKYCEP